MPGLRNPFDAAAAIDAQVHLLRDATSPGSSVCSAARAIFR
jgi:hypothetical protein